MSFTEQEFQEFKTEALELLEVAEKGLLSLDEGGDFKSTFDDVFRGFHNLKGAAGMMELVELQSHTHELETIFMRFKESDSIPKEHVTFFLRGIDAARTLLDGKPIQFDYNVTPSEVAPVVAIVVDNSMPDGAFDEFLGECDDVIERVSQALQTLEANAGSKELVDSLYRDFHSLKGAAFLFSAQNLGQIAHAMESSMEKVREGTHTTSAGLVSALFKCVKAIEKEVAALRSKTPDPKLSQIVPVLERLLSTEVSILPLARVAAPTETPQKPTVTDQGASDSAGSNTSIRVPVSLLDNLMTLMGEMVLVRNQVMQFSNRSEDQEFVNLGKRLNVVTSEIQEEMMKTRMQPIGNVLTKFNRIVRDLSHDLSKNINITLSGVETELDKSLLEAVKDPLTHIVRNSCDHGIETPQKRLENGKSEAGNIKISAYHESGQVVIEVSDDGRGLHKSALLKKAIEKNIITAAQAAQLNDKEIFGLIFAPGFSTAEQVTNVSGRGVGMDVVRTNIEKIGGTVDLSSVEGQGTNIKIKIPLTLAIVPALIVNAAQNVFAIPQVNLMELVMVDQSTDNRIEYIQGSPVYRLRGNLLPLVNLKTILGLQKDADQTQIANIAVVRADHCIFGLIVDEVQDTADIVVKPINRLLKSLQVYSGATIMGDGEVALILDVLGISKVAEIGAGKVSRVSKEAERKQLSSEQTIQEYLLVRMNSPTKHAIVLGYVHRIEEFKRSAVERSANERVIRYGNVILPLVSASEKMGYGPNTGTTNDTISVVVVKRSGQLYGIEVEEILDTLTTDIDMDTMSARHPCTFGNLNLAEELVVVVDPFELIGMSGKEESKMHLSPALAASPMGQPDASSQPGANWKNMPKLNVLIAEDTIFFQRLLQLLLKKAGHEMSIAADGLQALEMINRSDSNFDLIISDIEMPKMNGFELAKNVRRNPRYQSTPMMAVSSRADDKYQSEGIKAGFDVYLEKLKPDSFLQSISQLIQEKRKSA